MKLDVFTTEKMRTACAHMAQDIQRLDYISAHNMEADKVYRDVLKSMEESLCAIELSAGEMRLDESVENKDEKYRILLAEKEQEKCKRLYLAEHVKTINGILKDTSEIIDDIPKKILDEE